MEPLAGLVLTTIADPIVLEDYCANFSTYGHLKQVKAYVIPDRKTPASAIERCENLRKRGMNIVFPTLAEQDSFLTRVGFSPHLVPYNSDNRRNVGYLMALEDGCDFVISIDDDNYCDAQVDFYSGHSVVCREVSDAVVVDSDAGWFNICGLMDIEPDLTVYPRGFPYFARHMQPKVHEERRQVTVRINAGLWLSEPDMDGISWLVAPVRSTAFKGKSVVLGDGAWSPVNTQNTAIHRDAMVAYYFIRMGYPLAGIPIDRYGDIFSGYFVQACALHMGHRVRVGTPVTAHRRNSHNYLRDATNELACIWVLEDLLQWLPSQRLEGKSYGEAYLALSHLLEDTVSRLTGFIWTDATRGYFHSMAFCMREWVKACRRIGLS